MITAHICPAVVVHPVYVIRKKLKSTAANHLSKNMFWIFVEFMRYFMDALYLCTVIIWLIRGTYMYTWLACGWPTFLRGSWVSVTYEGLHHFRLEVRFELHIINASKFIEEMCFRNNWKFLISSVFILIRPVLILDYLNDLIRNLGVVSSLK